MEHPILFSGEMVRAIMEGRKTQTRRVIKPQPNDIRESPFVKSGIEDTHGYEIKRKYAPGDRLWVRETFIPDPPDDDSWDYNMYSDGCIHNMDEIPARFKNPKYVIYRAPLDFGPGLKWQPSIFMPRWASRITLEVVNVRVERVQEISEEDCCKEIGAPLKWEGEGDEPYHRDMRTVFRNLWNSINAKRYPKSSRAPKKIDKTIEQETKKEFYSWDANPWVWVIEFRKVERDGTSYFIFRRNGTRYHGRQKDADAAGDMA